MVETRASDYLTETVESVMELTQQELELALEVVEIASEKGWSKLPIPDNLLHLKSDHWVMLGDLLQYLQEEVEENTVH